MLDSMQVVLIDVQERARIIAILYVIVLAFASPFGAIAGVLSGMNRQLPFVLNTILLIIGLAIVSLVKGKRSEELSS